MQRFSVQTTIDPDTKEVCGVMVQDPEGQYVRAYDAYLLTALALGGIATQIGEAAQRTLATATSTKPAAPAPSTSLN